jgi:transposase InsO family protein
VVTTDSAHRLPVAPNLLDRRFDGWQRDQAWVADITYVPTGEGWLYLAAVMDLAGRRIVGWSMSENIDATLVCTALKSAWWLRKPAKGLLVHTDRGIHYKMQPYPAMLARRGVKQSMSRKGNCFDNAAIESFFGTLKAEYFHLERPDSVDALEAGVHDYVHYYNRERIKVGLQGLSPVEYRLRSTA